MNSFQSHSFFMVDLDSSMFPFKEINEDDIEATGCEKKIMNLGEKALYPGFLAHMSLMT